MKNKGYRSLQNTGLDNEKQYNEAKGIVNKSTTNHNIYTHETLAISEVNLQLEFDVESRFNDRNGLRVRQLKNM